MSARADVAEPREDLRAEHRDMTRRRIAHAVVGVLVEVGPARTSFPAVAERAGVSLRTVYRHFPNKDALLGAAVDAGTELTARAFPPGERSLGTVREFLPLFWQELHDNVDIVRAQHTSPEGIALRGRRLRERHKEVAAILGRDAPEVVGEDRDRLAALVTVLLGSPVLFDLVEHLGLAVDEAALVSAFAIESAIDAARAQGGLP